MLIFYSFDVAICSMLLFVRCCDDMTSCHDVTKPAWFTSQLVVDVLESWFFFVSMVFWVSDFKLLTIFYMYVFLFVCCHVMTSRHDVIKPASPISACGWARKMILCFHGFTGGWFRKCYHSCICVMTSRHNVTSWRHVITWRHPTTIIL